MEIGLGIVVAFFVNGLIFPVSSVPLLRSGLRRALVQTRKMMGLAVSGYLGNRTEHFRLESGIQELGKILAASNDAFSHTRLEQALTPSQRQVYATMLSYVACCREALVEVARLPALVGGSSYAWPSFRFSSRNGSRTISAEPSTRGVYTVFVTLPTWLDTTFVV